MRSRGGYRIISEQTNPDLQTKKGEQLF